MLRCLWPYQRPAHPPAGLSRKHSSTHPHACRQRRLWTGPRTRRWPAKPDAKQQRGKGQPDACPEQAQGTEQGSVCFYSRPTRTVVLRARMLTWVSQPARIPRAQRTPRQGARDEAVGPRIQHPLPPVRQRPLESRAASRPHRERDPARYQWPFSRLLAPRLCELSLARRSSARRG